VSRWLSNKDSALQSKKITFQVIFKPHEPLFPWAAGLPWGAFPRMVKELVQWAHAQGALTELGLDLSRIGQIVASSPEAMPEVAPLARTVVRERDPEVVFAEPFTIRRYKPISPYQKRSPTAQ